MRIRVAFNTPTNPLERPGIVSDQFISGAEIRSCHVETGLFALNLFEKLDRLSRLPRVRQSYGQVILYTEIAATIQLGPQPLHAIRPIGTSIILKDSPLDRL